MSFEALKSVVDAIVTTNANNEITGEVLRNFLKNNAIPQLGALQLKGVATVGTNPASSDREIFYLASDTGTYSNFGGLTIADQGIHVLFKQNGSWVAQTLLTVEEIIPNGSIQNVKIEDGTLTQSKLSQALIDFISSGGTITNNPDDIDLETKAGSTIGFKDRASSGNQIGYRIIRSGFDFTSIPAGYDNSIWEIRNVHDLSAANVTFPANVTLLFKGGYIHNYGILTGDNTKIDTANKSFDISGSFAGSWRNKAHPIWFGATGDGVADDSNFVDFCTTNFRQIALDGYNFKISSITVPDNTFISGENTTVITGTDVTAFILGDNCKIEKIRFQGNGKDSGNPNDRGLRLTSVFRNKIINCEFVDFGDAGIYANNIVGNHEGNLILGCEFDECNQGIELDERAEYTQVGDCIISRCNIGIRIQGGNNKVVGCTISDCENVSGDAVGIQLDAGDNDSHGLVSGCTINHCDFIILANALNVNEFHFTGNSIYAGSIYFNGCEGVVINGGAMGSIFIYEEGCRRCIVRNVFFQDTPTINENYNADPSEVYYLDCFYPEAVSATTEKGINGAYLEASRISSSQGSIGAGITNLIFNNIVFNALENNLNYTVHLFLNTSTGQLNDTKKIKRGYLLKSSSVITLSSLNDITASDIKVYFENDGGQKSYFQKVATNVGGGYYDVIFTHHGNVTKGNNRIKVDNNSGETLELRLSSTVDNSLILEGF